jgi:hypothetical protein
MRLWQGATIFDSSQTIYADSLLYNQNTEEGEGFGSVKMVDSTEKIQFASDYMKKVGGDEKIILRHHASITQYNDDDTLFIYADSIVHERDTITEMEKSLADQNVAIIKGDLSVSCDSAWFSEADSLAKLYVQPVMWNGMTQMSGDSIHADYYDKEFHEVRIYNNAMIVDEHEGDTLHYDQIKGKMMTAVLDSGKINRVYIETNAETLYYITKTSKDSLGTESESIDGLNKIDCNQITIYFTNGDIHHVAFIDQPVSVFYPVDRIPANSLFLKDFEWKIALRPTRGMFE